MGADPSRFAGLAEEGFEQLFRRHRRRELARGDLVFKARDLLADAGMFAEGRRQGLGDLGPHPSPGLLRAAGLDGTGLAPISRTEGTHRANFDPSFSRYIDGWSEAATPTQVRMWRDVLAVDSTDVIVNLRLGGVRSFSVQAP